MMQNERKSCIMGKMGSAILEAWFTKETKTRSTF